MSANSGLSRRLRWLCPLLLALVVGLALAVAPPAATRAEVQRASVSIPCPPSTQPQIPLPSGCEVSEIVSPEELCLGLTARPNTGVEPGAITTYQVKLGVVGQHHGRRIVVRLPLSPTAQDVVDATFSRPDAWVSAVMTDALDLRIDQLGPGEVLTATLRLRTRAEAAPGMAIVTRAQLAWAGDGGRAPVLSNPVVLVVGQSPDQSGPPPLSIIPATIRRDTRFNLTYDGFSAYELVSLWYNRPDGQVIAIAPVGADNAGRVSVAFSASDLVPGRHQFTARGFCSGVLAVGFVTVTGP